MLTKTHHLFLMSTQWRDVPTPPKGVLAVDAEEGRVGHNLFGFTSLVETVAWMEDGWKKKSFTRATQAEKS